MYHARITNVGTLKEVLANIPDNAQILISATGRDIENDASVGIEPRSRNGGLSIDVIEHDNSRIVEITNTNTDDMRYDPYV
jgi:hypothetical protein